MHRSCQYRDVSEAVGVSAESPPCDRPLIARPRRATQRDAQGSGRACTLSNPDSAGTKFQCGCKAQLLSSVSMTSKSSSEITFTMPPHPMCRANRLLYVPAGSSSLPLSCCSGRTPLPWPPRYFACSAVGFPWPARLALQKRRKAPNHNALVGSIV